MIKKNKLLLAIDGSEQALAAVRYVSMAPLRKMKVILFNVFAGMPEYYWDLELNE